MDSTLRRTWAEIDLDALAHNYRTLRARMGEQSRFLGVVKADAYGHGAVQISRVLEELGAAYLAVSSVDEARELRSAGAALPVLQLGLTPAEQTEQLLTGHITQTVWSERAALARRQAPSESQERSMRSSLSLDPLVLVPAGPLRSRLSLTAASRASLWAVAAWRWRP